ncbi:protein kinase family protein [Clostridium estertheticum]|uniref:protein kinase family protein n=1 Tax=Clostridium estertheticum TaxID=238834 RepID=UPI001C7DA9E0|nr:protein kinase family protein [Clostridium estertheticum]MBX4267546.1 protein kinase family protein [Clostridium estertheticum]WLC88640.1 protein kinase family protein [Clostridium estertheticum]
MDYNIGEFSTTEGDGFMLSDKNYVNILKYFDKKFWDNKTNETGWNYYGLVVDRYFDNSVLSIDYLDIQDYFQNNGNFSFDDEKYLEEQYTDIPINKRLEIVQNILNIIKISSINKEQSNQILLTVINVLKRFNIKVDNPETGSLELSPNDILDCGSYCNIVRVTEGVLKKELKPIYKTDENLIKRMKYEYENMEKLRECPQILNVYEFIEEENAYLMETGDKNLYKHLTDEMDISFEGKLKIIMDVLKGMEFAHGNSIIHRDLHLGNVLKINNDFAICDFGLSKDLSIERSLKTSFTEKNNHIFVDPLAINDFRKLDKKSDIYSIGKIIDYILTYNSATPDHQFKTVVERCMCRDKELRYDSVTKIINEIESILKNQGKEDIKQETVNKILNYKYDCHVHDLILDLVNTDKLSKFIVQHQLYEFGNVIFEFESVYQEKILHSISNGFIDATGFGGWSNYDIFAQIAYYIYVNSIELQIKKIAKNILEACASKRFGAEKLLDSLEL